MRRWQPGMLFLVIAWGVSAPNVAADDVDYTRDVKPILKARCFRCHGPLKSESGLRLDTKALALRGGESGPVLTPGNSATSELVRRITDNGESRMPPESERLTSAEIETLKKWIAGGAIAPADETAENPRAHWSFQPIERPKPPAVDAEWSRNPIDAFVARKHQAAKVVARPPAGRQVLLRRVYLDLIGLPPSREQLRAFLTDESPNAYERVVDDLLASPHYGERWGRHWLDVWRYSDWYGFQDQVRFSQKNIWHWRDWAVESLNTDKGYGQMVMEMLAGDEMVPFDPGNLRATGFLVRNRNTDSREQWIRDTVEHTAKAFLGITIACVQCHDHPYDPIWHEEYYRFRNIFEPVQVGIDSGGGGPGGVDLAGVARIFDRDRNAKTRFYIRGNDRTPDETRNITPGVPQVLSGLWTEPEKVQLPPVARIPHLREPVHRQTIARLEYNVRQSERAIVSAERYLAETRRRLANRSTDNSTPASDTFLIEPFQDVRTDIWKQGRGQWDNGKGFLAQTLINEQRDCYLEAIAAPPVNFTLRLRLRITGATEGLVGVMFNRSPDGSRGEAVVLSAHNEDSGLRFFFEYGDERHFHGKYARDLPIKIGEEIVLRVDVHGGVVNIYVNDLLQQAYKVNSDPGAMRLLTIGAAVEFHHLRIDPLPADAPLVPAGSIPLFATFAHLDPLHPSHLALADAVIEHSKLQLDVNKAELASYKATWATDSWKLLNSPPKEDEAANKIHQMKYERLAIASQSAQRRLTLSKAKVANFTAEHELKGAEERAAAGTNGDQEENEKLTKAVEGASKKSESTTQQVAAAEKALTDPPMPKYQGLQGSYGSSSGRRRSLARWVADSQNTLTARVAVNHIWLRHFGQPLVSTLFDFGTNGAMPSHPDLLDWLAYELMHPSLVSGNDAGDVNWVEGKPAVSPWSMKHLHRLIVTSRTYRSASTPDDKNLAIDPDNRFLWRMSPRRMEAETVRDGVLAVAGQLDRTLGGPDLPYSDGMNVARRSLYFHQSPERQMEFLKLFDGADATECYQRHVSIVPHQALALFNSELTLGQSRKLARRLSEEFADDRALVEAAFEQVLARPASDNESKICLAFLAERERVYRANDVARVNDRESEDENEPSADPRLHARENLVHSLFNHHDFVTIR